MFCHCVWRSEETALSKNVAEKIGQPEKTSWINQQVLEHSIDVM
jgi:hypothetical protein